MPGRRDQAAQDQDLVEHGEVAAGLEQRDEAVAHSLQAREARSGRYPYQEPRGLRAVTAEEIEAERGDRIVLRGGEAKLSKDEIARFTWPKKTPMSYWTTRYRPTETSTRPCRRALCSTRLPRTTARS